MRARSGAGHQHNASQPHLLESVDTNSYLYDPNGNVARRQGPNIPSGVQDIVYTPFDLPSAIATGVGQGTKLSKFEYSADEERLVRRDTGPSIDRTRHFVTDLYQRLTDNIAGATLEERFRIYAGSREVAQVVRENGVDKTLYFHADHLGTPETITTSDGDVAHQDLDPWGGPTTSGSTELTRVGFTGHEHDRDLGLIDMKGRVYDPLAARFTSADPVMQAPFWSQGLNRYAYVFNNPVNHTDPTGFEIVIQADMPGIFIDLDIPLIDLDGVASSGASSSSAATSTGSSAPSAGPSAGGGGAALGSALGMGSSVLNTVSKALQGGFLGQRSTPSSKSQSTSAGGSQAANSVPNRAGTDAASANKPVEVPTEGPPNQAFASPVPNSNLNALMDAAPDIGASGPTYEAIGEGMETATNFAGVGGLLKSVGKAILKMAVKQGAKAAARGAGSVGRTVLGHHPEYIEKAAELGARRFNIPTSVWENMSDAQRWTANQKFLDRMIARGDEIILARRLGRREQEAGLHGSSSTWPAGDIRLAPMVCGCCHHRERVMTKTENLKVIAQRLLESAGLSHNDVIHESLRPDHFGDGEVVFKVGPTHLRFVRERGQDFLDVSPASAPGRYHPYGDVELAMGWKTVDQVWSRTEPEPLRAILERLRSHYPQFEEAFSETKAQETLAKLDFASRRRSSAFVDHLRRLAEEARKK